MLEVLGRLAQLARVSRLHREGRGFEPLSAHHNKSFAVYQRFFIYKDKIFRGTVIRKRFDRIIMRDYYSFIKYSKL